jgi:catechol 2,3-dioxygenase-like lactoylglutathione lyase family enzyme
VIHHVALEVRRADAGDAERFWARLGFARVDPPPSLAERTAWMEREGTQIHLMWADDPVAPPAGHVAVIAGDDYDAVLERLRGAGHEPEPRREHWGSPRCFVRAPGGHRVEVMAWPPGAGA